MSGLLPLSMADVLLLALLGGVLGLDVVSFPQAMISRPIVGCTIGGAFLGEPLAGLTCGAALECLALESLPVGATRYPEWGSASVVAGAIAAMHVTPAGLPAAGSFALSVAAGIIASWLGGASMIRLRRFNAGMARKSAAEVEAGSSVDIVRIQLFGLTMDLLRGVLVCLMMIILLTPLASIVDDRWSVRSDISRAVVITCVAAVAAASVWKDFHSISGTRRLFLISLSVGTLVVILGA